MVETIGDRIKKLREDYLKMNQRLFSKEIGISQPALAMFETGDREPKEIHIKNICLKSWNGKFVNEDWLRTGIGGDDNIFKKNFIENEYLTYAMEIGNGGSELIKAAIVKYGRLSPENKKIIDDALNLILSEIKKGE